MLTFISIGVLHRDLSEVLVLVHGVLHLLAVDRRHRPPVLAARVDAARHVELPGEESVEGLATLANVLHGFLPGVDALFLPRGQGPVDEVTIRIVPKFKFIIIASKGGGDFIGISCGFQMSTKLIHSIGFTKDTFGAAKVENVFTLHYEEVTPNR